MDTPFPSYCDYINRLKPEEFSIHKAYHDEQYGFPLHGDNELFGRLILEINQAGLSLTTILKKQENFRKAYDQFDIATVAAYGDAEKQRLLADPGIIRNRLKIEAAVHNAQVIQGLQREHGSFKNWLDLHHLKTKEEWTRLFKKTFRFTGGEIVNEFLMSTGYLPGAHGPGCPVYSRIAALHPAWMKP